MILITGGMGFIGLHTARRILDTGEDVVVTYFQTWREPSFMAGEYGKRVHVEKLDVSDQDAVSEVVRRHEVDGIIHLAVPGLGALSPAEEFRANTQGLLAVLEAGREHGVKRVSLASSVAVYASLPAGPFTEDMPLPMTSGNPTEAYKKAWEVLGLHFGSRTGMEVVALRIGGIYGPLYHSMANLPSRLVHAAVRGTEPDFSDARGGVPFEDAVADLCYVKDCAVGIALVQLAPSLAHPVYNVGAGRGTRNAALCDAVTAAVSGAGFTLREGPGPRSRPEGYMDTSRILDELGFEPHYDIVAGVADYAAWLGSNQQ